MSTTIESGAAFQRRREFEEWRDRPRRWLSRHNLFGGYTLVEAPWTTGQERAARWKRYQREKRPFESFENFQNRKRYAGRPLA